MPDIIVEGDDVEVKAIVGGGYAAADRISQALATWTPPLKEIDQEAIPHWPIIEARAQDMARNDGYVQNAITLHQNSVVGAWFRLNATPDVKALGIDDPVWEEEFQEEVEAKFSLWAESPENWPDAARRMAFTGLIRLAVGVYLVSGEFLGVFEWMRDADRPLHTAFQPIELLRLRTPPEFAHDDAVRAGIRVTKAGVPKFYYIYDRARDSYGAADTYRALAARLPNGRPRVFHIVKHRRPGQTRGISDLAAGLKEMKIARQFREVTLQNAVVNASFAAAIESELPAEQVFMALGAGNTDPAAAVKKYAQAFLSSVQEYVGNARHMQVDGVKIPHLYPGTKLHLHQLGTPGGVGQDFEKSLLRHLAATLGVSYEDLTRDFSETNYSSARAAALTVWREMQARKREVADKLATMIYRCWFEEVANLHPSKGGLECMRGRKLPNMYDGLNMEAYTKAEWIGAARGQVDELKETQAAVLRVKYGLSTRRMEAARLGQDWRDVAVQQAREKKLFEKLGLEEPKDDKMMNAASGSPREIKDEDGRSPTNERKGDAPDAEVD